MVGTQLTDVSQGLPSLQEILRCAVSVNASDIHLRAGQPPLVRVDGQLMPLQFPALSPQWASKWVNEALPSDQARAEYAASHDYDFALDEPGIGRFRVNAYRSRGMDSLVLRHVREVVPTLDQLGLPQTVSDLALRGSGLILVSGPSGSGKSTTLAAMISTINSQRTCHILTIEDPLEFLHSDQSSTVSQREIGTDTAGFSSALRAALRQDPDVIVIGEIRDYETMSIAMQAAETGHLVLASIHGASVAETVQRVLDLFPHGEQAHARAVLAEVIQGIISQRLVPGLEHGIQKPILEIAVSTPRICRSIADPNKTHELSSIIADGDFYGMFTHQQDAVRQILAGSVSVTAAESVVASASDLKLMLKQSGYASPHE